MNGDCIEWEFLGGKEPAEFLKELAPCSDWKEIWAWQVQEGSFPDMSDEQFVWDSSASTIHLLATGVCAECEPSPTLLVSAAQAREGTYDPSIECSHCKCWFHKSCSGTDTRNIPDHQNWYCNRKACVIAEMEE